MKVVNKIKIYKEEGEITIDFRDLQYDEHVDLIEKIFSKVMKEHGYYVYKNKK